MTDDGQPPQAGRQWPAWLWFVVVVLGFAVVVVVAGRLPDRVLELSLKTLGILVLGYVLVSGGRMIVVARREGVPMRSIAAAVVFVLALLAVVVFLADL
jgi:hypothetical protein